MKYLKVGDLVKSKRGAPGSRKRVLVGIVTAVRANRQAGSPRAVGSGRNGLRAMVHSTTTDLTCV